SISYGRIEGRFGRREASRWIYRMGATQEWKGDIVSPHSVVAPESALGSVPTVALSSAQVRIVVGSGLARGECSSRHGCSNSSGVWLPSAALARGYRCNKVVWWALLHFQEVHHEPLRTTPS